MLRPGIYWNSAYWWLSWLRYCNGISCQCDYYSSPAEVLCVVYFVFLGYKLSVDNIIIRETITNTIHHDPWTIGSYLCQPLYQTFFLILIQTKDSLICNIFRSLKCPLCVYVKKGILKLIFNINKKNALIVLMVFLVFFYNRVHTSY